MLVCLTAVSLFALAATSVYADYTIPVPGGNFDTIYKPGTDQTVYATGTSSYYGQLGGANVGTLDWGQINWSDSSVTTAGGSFEVLGWNGYGTLMADGNATSGWNCYQASYDPKVWTGSLGTIAANTDYTVGMDAKYLQGNSLFVSLNANDVGVDPRVITLTGDWSHYSTTFTAAQLQSYVGQSMNLVVGGGNTNLGDWPAQMRIDGVTLTAHPTPEPGTLALVVTGAIGLLAYAWRKRK
jgi:hypothetical protein